MERRSIERRIRHLQREVVRLSLSTDPRRGRLTRSLLAAIAKERRILTRPELRAVRQSPDGAKETRAGLKTTASGGADAAQPPARPGIRSAA